MTPHSRISGISTELSQAWAGCAPGLAPSLCTSSESPLFASHFPSHGPWTPSLHSKGRCSLQPSNTASGYGLLEHGTRAGSTISKAAHRNNKLSPFLQTRQSVHFSSVRHSSCADPVLGRSQLAQPNPLAFPSCFGTALAVATSWQTPRWHQVELGAAPGHEAN